MAESIAFFEGRFVPLSEAKVSVQIHALNYGTAIFEGIRGYYNELNGQMYLFRLRDHYSRMLANCKLIKVDLPYDVDALCALTVELIRRCGFKENIYVRPLAYKNACQIGTKLVPGADITIFAVPMGDYIPTDRALKVCISSWRRIEDNSIPARGKICGSYVNSALAATEARDNGFDEAIVLNNDGHVAEGAAMNLFMVRAGELVTTPITANILEGITRDTVIKIARQEFGLSCQARQIDRTELYLADELFFCGTGAQIAAIGSVDHRVIGDGRPGPITLKLTEAYSKIVRGMDKKYIEWCTPVYEVASVEQV
ncbi:MAG: branched-chain amino acid transaminase [Acidobacteriota bacterium]|nr:branched-chain amino acid transaminase [Blastocatellia bacterium]MDW8411393.1 branched-chain amino acid transaminase [Acidobacteriota bacterium]